MAARFLLSLALLFLSAPLGATTLDFRTMGTSGWQSTLAFDGVTIEGATETGGQVQSGGTEIAHWQGGALGARGADDSGIADGTEQIDTYGANDAVIFRFDRIVRLERISFVMTDWWDRFDLFLGDEMTYQRTYKVDDRRGYDWVSTIFLGTGYEGTTFAIGASEYQSCGYAIDHGHACWTENSAFRISGITFSEIELTNVPLPSAALFLFTAALGLGGMRARRGCPLNPLI